MKTASTTLKNFLAAEMASADSQFAYADCYRFTLRTGTILYYTSADVPVVYGGNTYLANTVLVSGLKYRSTTGLNVDTQELDISAPPTVLVNGNPIMAAIASGIFELCIIERFRVFWSDHINGTVVDGLLLYKGRIATVDEVGRLSAKITVADELMLLDIDMPRNTYVLTCNNVLYDSSCTLARASYATAGTILSGSTQHKILTPVGLAQHVGGYLQMTSGNNTGIQATVKAVNPGFSIDLTYPLPLPLAVGNTFSVYYGCDHTRGTCNSTFGNLAHFKGYPYVPPAQYAR